MNADLESLESFLNEVGKHITPPKETTIFALGGRGYYENPATELLKFFLKPDAGHGLGDLFLSTFLECIGEGHRQLDLRSIDIGSQVETDKGNFIDLQILGRDWCLIIENKIYHGPANPFLDYEAHAEKSGKGTKIFSILSPYKTVPPEGSATKDRWEPVIYKDYCQKLRDRMATKFFDVPFSKWHIFAREFILHIENELGLNRPPMKQEDAQFVEDNAAKFDVASQLKLEYENFVCDELKRHLEERVTGSFFHVKTEWWRFSCMTDALGVVSEIDLVKKNAITKDDKMGLRIYLSLNYITEPEQSKVMSALNFNKTGEGQEKEERYFMWDSVERFDSRDKAIAKLCECAKTVNGLIKK